MWRRCPTSVTNIRDAGWCQFVGIARCLPGAAVMQSLYGGDVRFSCDRNHRFSEIADCTMTELWKKLVVRVFGLTGSYRCKPAGC